MKICSVEGCESPKRSRVYCGKHHAKYKAYGDPLAGRQGTPPGSLIRWVEDHKDYGGEYCIKWPFEVSRYGYGVISYKGKKTTASRVMCIFAHGDPPTGGMDAAHSCGKGHEGCMNPNHLSWKTRKENVHDAMAHKTWMRGAKTPQAVVDDDKAREIYNLRDSLTQKQIAEKFGISAAVVQRIHCGRNWKHVTGGKALESPFKRGSRNANAKVNEEDVREIRKLRGSMLQREIAEIYGIDKSQVGKIQRGEWWSWVKDE